MTDIEIAKKLVKEQQERRKDNYKEFVRQKEGRRTQESDWLKRLLDNKHI